ncbi:MAG: DUF4199 domain-containing protein [Rikenellaceae bacterium]|nr:DUF4199 domain-containing protein [Rikenellaceae bacterium]
MEEYKKNQLQEASKWGLILGITIFALNLAGSAFGAAIAILCSVLQIFAIYVINMNIGRKMRTLKEMYTFGDSMKTILLTMVFSGIIVGAGEFLVKLNSIDYFDKVFELQLERFKNNPDYIQILEENRGMMERIMGNPITMVIIGIINMVIFGGVIGLVNSAYLRNDRQIK